MPALFMHHSGRPLTQVSSPASVGGRGNSGPVFTAQDPGAKEGTRRFGPFDLAPASYMLMHGAAMANPLLGGIFDEPFEQAAGSISGHPAPRRTGESP